MARCVICDYSEDADTLYRDTYYKPRRVIFNGIEFRCTYCEDSIQDTLKVFLSEDDIAFVNFQLKDQDNEEVDSTS